MKKGNIFWGVFLILCAFYLVMSQMNLFPSLNVWGVLLSVFFVSSLVGSIKSKSFGGIFFSLAFLGIIYDKQLHIENLTPWTLLLAALLLTIGFNILMSRKGFSDTKFLHNHNAEEVETIIDEGEPMDFKVSFGGGVKYINSDDFKYANVSCTCGGLSVFFDNAIIQEGEAVINCDVTLGGVELYVPKEWTVRNELNLFMAAMDEKNQNQSTGTPILHIKGRCKLGGIEVTYI